MTGYKDYGEIRKNRANFGARFVFFLHKRLVKPQKPLLLHCPGCGRPFLEANSDTIEVSNSFGIPQDSLKASDNWVRHKCHSCAASISILWK